jgi:hypothetical protein
MKLLPLKIAALLLLISLRGYGQQPAGNRASLSFNAIDIFNTPKRAILRTSDQLITDLSVRMVGSSATFTFTYRIGRDP